jgi:hypothetical protein
MVAGRSLPAAAGSLGCEREREREEKRERERRKKKGYAAV